MNKAIFLDRDGTLIEHIKSTITGLHRAAFYPGEVKFYPQTIECLQKLQRDFGLFLVSNQPDAAKDNIPYGNLYAVHYKFNNILLKNDIHFKEFYYCWHKSSDKCICRKPSIYYPLIAQDKYNIDFSQSWFIGDQDVDTWCGRDAGMKTILLDRYSSKHLRGKSAPNYTAKDLPEAVNIIYENFVLSTRFR